MPWSSLPQHALCSRGTKFSKPYIFASRRKQGPPTLFIALHRRRSQVTFHIHKINSIYELPEGDIFSRAHWHAIYATEKVSSLFENFGRRFSQTSMILRYLGERLAHLLPDDFPVFHERFSVFNQPDVTFSVDMSRLLFLHTFSVRSVA